MSGETIVGESRTKPDAQSRWVQNLVLGAVVIGCGYAVTDARAQIADLVHRNAVMETRIAVVEASKEETNRRLDGMERKLDRVLYILSGSKRDQQP